MKSFGDNIFGHFFGSSLKTVIYGLLGIQNTFFKHWKGPVKIKETKFVLNCRNSKISAQSSGHFFVQKFVALELLQINVKTGKTNILMKFLKNLFWLIRRYTYTRTIIMSVVKWMIYQFLFTYYNKYKLKTLKKFWCLNDCRNMYDFLNIQ